MREVLDRLIALAGVAVDVRQRGDLLRATELTVPCVDATKLRRETPSSNSLAPTGNSRSSHSRNSGVSATSSRLRQYFGPVSGCGQGGGIVFIYDTRSMIAADARSSAAPARFRQNSSAVASPDW